MDTNAFKDENFVENEESEISDSFVCCVCLELLYKPIVLPCGHVSCFWCVHNSMDGIRESRCPICRRPYYHFPTICQMLHFLLLKMYPVAYKIRENQILGSSSGSMDNEEGEKINWCSGSGWKVHIGVGCDFCGMYPIIGDRYRCLDCKEKIGFDLCGNCYNTRSELPGRFNQQHTHEHKFELLPPFGAGIFENLELISQEPGLSDDEDNQNESEATN